MKNRLVLYFGIILGISSMNAQEYIKMIDAGTYSVAEIIESAETYFVDKDKGRGSGYKQFKRWEYNALRLMNENGYLSSITENIVELERYNAYLNETASERISLSDNWTELGPHDWNATTSWNPGVGRITGIAIDNANEDHIIIGANTGGVWRTIDGGQNWTPMGDFFSNLYVYSVAIDPMDSDVYFFGSSNGLIYKSEDAGATWNHLGTIGNSSVNKILLHPSDPNILFATASYAGIYKSVDAGLSWQQAVSDSAGYDIEFSPSNPTVVFASGNAVHKSVDGGATFSTISGFNSGPKMIGVSESDTDRVYVLEANGGTFGGFYSSIDAGDSFTQLDHGGNNYFGYSTTAQDNSGQAPRDMDITVNPNDEDEVHIAGVLTWRSLDGGVNFTCTADWVPGNAASAGIGYCHADVDILEFYGSTLYAGTDGGIFKATNTSDLNANYYTDLTAGIGIRQFYKIGITQTSDVVVTGGSQDNGSSFYTAAEGWKDWIGADGMEGFVDKDDSDVMYGMIQFGGMYRTDNGASSIVGLSSPGSGGWVTPFEQDPIDANTIYMANSQIHKSENKGNSWSAISQNLGTNINHLKIAQSDNQVMYTARGVRIYRTSDGGATDWMELTSPGGFINSIAIHPSKPDKVAVATTSGDKVLVSEDGGITWASYVFNLPGFSATALVWDDNGADGLYLGMNYGLFYIDNESTEWQPFYSNLPNVIINELEINSVDETIYAGTYGRGLWASPIVPHILNTDSFITERNVSIYPNPASSTVTIKLQKAVEVDIRVFDLLGKLVIYQADVSISNEHTLDISKLKKAVYFIRMNTEVGSVTKKLIKE